MRGRLYHFCCGHSATAIDRSLTLAPGLDWFTLDRRLARAGEPISGLSSAPAVLWLTDMEEPDRDALGLTSHMLDCDRTEFRYTVRTEGAIRWESFVSIYNPRSDWLDMLHYGRQPDRWFVATSPRRVLSRIDRRALARKVAS